MSGTNTTNEYQQSISQALYQRIPKSVLAALVVSELINKHGLVTTEDIDKAIKDEWFILNDNGIVPQRVPNIKAEVGG